MKVGIESIGVYLGAAAIDINVLADNRKLDKERLINNLIINEKSVALPFEDPVTFAVNAAKNLIENLPHSERTKIDMIITCTESGIDMAKSLSTYVHRYLGLDRNCRLFELKNACYSGTAALQMAINSVLSNTSPNSKTLVICTDIYRMFKRMMDKDILAYYEPNTGAGAIAFLVSNNPEIISFDIGANGYYSYEVWDSSQPTVDFHFANADLSLLSYMDAAEGSFLEYSKRVKDVNYENSFDYLVYHTPFVGMVKGVHRTLLRKLAQASQEKIIEDYKKRVEPGTELCKRVGNIMSGSLFLALVSLLERLEIDNSKRVGLFSYGSGCSSEFFSGVISKLGIEKVKKEKISQHLDKRYLLTFDEYENLIDYNENLRFGNKGFSIQKGIVPQALERIKGTGYLVLDKIEGNYYRQYSWI